VGTERGDRQLTKLEDRYAGYDVVDDRTGEKIGSVEAAFLDERDQHEYVAVRMGLAGLIPGTGSSLIPMDLVARVDNDRRTIEVPRTRTSVKGSPREHLGGLSLSSGAVRATTSVASKRARRLHLPA
jgi:hypothetical protein